MIRRTKGTKRYATQREKRFTDPLIREDELKTVREAQQRLTRSQEIVGKVNDKREK